MCRIPLVALFVLIPYVAGATTATSFTIATVVANSEKIAHVRIIEAEVKYFDYEGRQTACGIAYRARVVELLGSDSVPKEIDFQSNSSLAANAEYLIFLFSHSDLSPNLVKPIAEYVDKPEFSVCRNQLPQKLSGGFAFRFHDSIRAHSGNALWLEMSDLSPNLPQEVKVMKVTCDVDHDLKCDAVSEPVLVNWPSLKSFILESIRSSTPKEE